MAHPFDEDPILVEVVRNGFVESVHRGRVVVTGSGGVGSYVQPLRRLSMTSLPNRPPHVTQLLIVLESFASSEEMRPSTWPEQVSSWRKPPNGSMLWISENVVAMLIASYW